MEPIINPTLIYLVGFCGGFEGVSVYCIFF